MIKSCSANYINTYDKVCANYMRVCEEETESGR